MNGSRWVAAGLIVAALALAGCGGSSKASGGVSAAAYVRSVCTATTSWRNAIQSAGTQLQASASSKSLAKTKSAYVTFVGALVNATGVAGTQLGSAGSPSVTNGKKIATTLVQIFDNAKTKLSHAASDATAIPTGSVNDFQTASNKVETDVRNALAGMSSASPEKSPQLHAAAAKDPTCKSLAAKG